VFVEKGVLIVRLEHAPAKSLELIPVDPDTFQRAIVTMRFQRDKAGKVVALHYRNPMLRNMLFKKIN
jgi:hypothetical protein